VDAQATDRDYSRDPVIGRADGDATLRPYMRRSDIRPGVGSHPSHPPPFSPYYPAPALAVRDVDTLDAAVERSCPCLSPYLS